MTASGSKDARSSDQGFQERLGAVGAELDAKLGHTRRRFCADRAVALSRIWLVTQICTLAVVISGVAVALQGGSSSYGFLGFYIAGLSLLMTVAGTCILRKYRSPAHHGLLLGLSFMMANFMLFNAVAVSTRVETPEGTTAAEVFVGAFSVFLFALYSMFTVLLQLWKDDIVVDDVDEGIELEGGSTQAQNGSSTDGPTDLKMV
mmetsp:Transcript_20913/g.38895  ORF Transcript_20913/g.38895 Transcript_20913/m.38895 type:complete len:204 (-) Transcript_20913:1340-1951(-)